MNSTGTNFIFSIISLYLKKKKEKKNIIVQIEWCLSRDILQFTTLFCTFKNKAAMNTLSGTPCILYNYEVFFELFVNFAAWVLSILEKLIPIFRK